MEIFQFYMKPMEIAGNPQNEVRNNWFLMVLFGVVLAGISFGFIFPESYDNDIWFILATGREIIENGIPYINPFAVPDNLSIVVQQWIPCVIAYAIYSSSGFFGLGILTVGLVALLMISLYRLGRMLREDKFGGELLFLVMVLVLLGVSPYTSFRPHLYTMIAFTWVIFFLEKYRKTDTVLWLIPLPFIIALHVNFHAAMAPFDLVIIVCYLIPDFLRPFHNRGKLLRYWLAESEYKRAPLFVVLFACSLAMLANPYLIDGALYLVNSYGAAGYKDHINEMKALRPAGKPTYFLIVILPAIAAVCAGAMGSKRINVPLLLLVIGTTVIGYIHSRNMWLPSLFCFVYIAWASRGHAILFPRRVRRSKALTSVMSILGIAVSVALIFYGAPKVEDHPQNNNYTPVAAMDYLDEHVEDKSKVNVFTNFNCGGYIEFRGFKVNIDPRPELWNSAITGDRRDYYYEYIDMSSGNMYFETYLKQFPYNAFVFNNKDSAMVSYFENDDTYEEIPSGEDYKAFVSKSLLNN